MCQLQIGTCQELLPLAEQQQGHLPSASGENEPYGAATDFSPLKGVQGGLRHSAPGNLVEQVFGESDIFRNCFHDANPCISSYLEKH